MTALLGLTGREKVLEIGTGSGDPAAVLGELAAGVCTVERIPRLASRARQVLQALGCLHVVDRGDGELRAAEHSGGMFVKVVGKYAWES